ncbi:hypothetical protein BD626DRAFT_574141 [Schizophyllum amplum]|uniref:Uncharacterized protein n=1 Tax=Schizophyllum amplum TaxID=97359 RepID=A0A550BZ57_9AGAR|nr:hypothetical protein BD626DRAFT_574141 [Auriculariopsis ampla]
MTNIAEVADVLLLIFEQVLHLSSEQDAWHEPPRSLLPIVLVSRLWNELATPLLWKKVTSRAIWNLLPADCRYLVHSQGQYISLLHPWRPLDDADWAPTAKLSYHIKTLCHSRDSGVYLTAGVLAALPPLDALFPSMEHIIYKAYLHVNGPKYDADNFHAYLSSSLRSITLDSNTDFIPDIPRIARCCPNLEKLIMRSEASIDVLTVQQIDAALASLSNLAQVSLRLPSPNKLHHLSAVGRSPSIQSLIITGSNPSRYLCTPLRTLMLLNLPHARATSNMIASFGPGARPIEALCLRPYILCDETDDTGMHHLSALTARAAAHCSPSTLTVLRIDCVQFYSEHALRVDHLRPFAAHTRLVRVYLRVSRATALDDGAVGELARWWPMLEDLGIFGYGLPGASSTLRALESLAVHCPQLQSLAIALDATNVPESSNDVRGDTTSSGVLRCGLRRLSVCGGRVPNPVGVAAYLDALFPALVEVCSSTKNNESVEEWREVNDLLSPKVDFAHG